jgi:hypothetical protein
MIFNIILATLFLRTLMGLVISHQLIIMIPRTSRMLDGIHNDTLEQRAIALLEESIGTSFLKEIITLSDLSLYLEWRKLHKEVLAYERSVL